MFHKSEKKKRVLKGVELGKSGTEIDRKFVGSDFLLSRIFLRVSQLKSQESRQQSKCKCVGLKSFCREQGLLQQLGWIRLKLDNVKEKEAEERKARKEKNEKNEMGNKYKRGKGGKMREKPERFKLRSRASEWRSGNWVLAKPLTLLSGIQIKSQLLLLWTLTDTQCWLSTTSVVLCEWKVITFQSKSLFFWTPLKYNTQFISSSI